MRQDVEIGPGIGASLMTAGAPVAYSDHMNTLHWSNAMVAHAPAKAVFSLRPFVLVLLASFVISAALGWALASPAAPEPAGPEPARVPAPPAAASAGPVQNAPASARPAPQLVPTPPAVSTILEPQAADSEAAPAAPGMAWVLPLAGLISLALGLKLRRAAQFQPHAFAR